MREALPKDGLFSSDQTRPWSASMYDQQIAQQMTAGKGIGLADMMVKQMTAGRRCLQMMRRKYRLNSPLGDGKQLSKSGADPTGAQSHTPKTPDSSVMRRSPATVRLRPSSFGETGQRTKRVPHHSILAGGAGPAGAAANPAENGEPSYNAFGVKATASWKAAGDEITTTEYENGEAKSEKRNSASITRI